MLVIFVTRGILALILLKLPYLSVAMFGWAAWSIPRVASMTYYDGTTIVVFLPHYHNKPAEHAGPPATVAAADMLRRLLGELGTWPLSRSCLLGMQATCNNKKQSRKMLIMGQDMCPSGEGKVA